MKLARLADEERAVAEAFAIVGEMSERDLLIAGIALYAGEGAKTSSGVILANTDPALISLFCRWLRQFFEVDEARLRCRLYLHQGLDLDAAIAFWVARTSIPAVQFTKPYRAVADESRRKAKHENGCLSVVYQDLAVKRRVLAMVDAITFQSVIPR